MRGAMGDMQHFCLRWNNYQSSITSAFENLRDDEDFVDVTLACDGKSLKAHRVVLSACSPYFRELLKSTPCKHPVIVLQDVMFEDLHALVEFIYHGEVNVRQRSLSSFLKTAEVLRVSGLTQQSEAVSMGLDKSAGLADGSGFPLYSRKNHKHKDRPSSTPENLENQDNSIPVKRPKNEPSTNSHGERSPPNEDVEEPPVDFSTTGSNNNMSSVRDKHESLSSDTPPLSTGGGTDIKPEPIELTPSIQNERELSCQISTGGDSDSNGDTESNGGGASSAGGDRGGGGVGDRGGGTGGGGGPLLPGPPPSSLSFKQEHEDSLHSSHNYLDAKLFPNAAGFTFSMAAALAADSLGLNSQSHGMSSSDGLAGTSSQGVWHRERPGRPLNNHRPDEPSFVCDVCRKRYRTISSLRNHKSVYHRQNRPNDRKKTQHQQQSYQVSGNSSNYYY